MRLPRTARAVFALVLDNARLRGGLCRLSNGTMGGILGCCPMTIGRALVALESAGLVRRELSHGGRIRSGILVTWDGVQQECLTERPCVQQEGGRGSTFVSKGVQHSCGTNQSPIQREISDADRSSLRGGEEDDPASRVASGPEAAAYLRACIDASKKGLQPPPPPVSAKSSQAVQGEPTAPPAPITAPIVDRPAAAEPAASTTTPRRVEPCPTTRTAVQSSATPASTARRTYSPASYVPAGEAVAMVRRMVNDLAEDVKAADVGRRRVAPRKLAAKLAEIRRRHGRRE